MLDTISTIQEVSETPKLKFNGYPAVTIVPSDNTGDYETTTENIRTYAFLVRIFNETKDTGVADALNALGEVVDAVLDAFDEEDLLPSTTRKVGISLPAKYTFLNVWATPSLWAEIPGESLIMAELRVRVRLSVDISG